MAGKTSIQVNYKSVEGWHIFTSEELPGLYVASTNAKKAYDDVAIAIQMLMRLDSGIRCRVVPEVPLSAILKGSSARRAPTVRARTGARPVPAALYSRRYVVDCHA
jgi:hypothetical protein